MICLIYFCANASNREKNGGIKSIIIPFDIDSIFCSTTDATSQTTLSLEKPYMD